MLGDDAPDLGRLLGGELRLIVRFGQGRGRSPATLTSVEAPKPRCGHNWFTDI